MTEREELSLRKLSLKESYIVHRYGRRGEEWLERKRKQEQEDAKHEALYVENVRFGSLAIHHLLKSRMEDPPSVEEIRKACEKIDDSPSYQVQKAFREVFNKPTAEGLELLDQAIQVYDTWLSRLEKDPVLPLIFDLKWTEEELLAALHAVQAPRNPDDDFDTLFEATDLQDEGSLEDHGFAAHGPSSPPEDIAPAGALPAESGDSELATSDLPARPEGSRDYDYSMNYVGGWFISTNVGDAANELESYRQDRLEPLRALVASVKKFVPGTGAASRERAELELAMGLFCRDCATETAASFYGKLVTLERSISFPRFGGGRLGSAGTYHRMAIGQLVTGHLREDLCGLFQKHADALLELKAKYGKEGLKVWDEFKLVEHSPLDALQNLFLVFEAHPEVKPHRLSKFVKDLIEDARSDALEVVFDQPTVLDTFGRIARYGLSATSLVRFYAAYGGYALVTNGDFKSPVELVEELSLKGSRAVALPTFIAHFEAAVANDDGQLFLETMQRGLVPDKALAAYVALKKTEPEKAPLALQISLTGLSEAVVHQQLKELLTGGTSEIATRPANAPQRTPALSKAEKRHRYLEQLGLVNDDIFAVEAALSGAELSTTEKGRLFQVCRANPAVVSKVLDIFRRYHGKPELQIVIGHSRLWEAFRSQLADAPEVAESILLRLTEESVTVEDSNARIRAFRLASQAMGLQEKAVGVLQAGGLVAFHPVEPLRPVLTRPYHTIAILGHHYGDDDIRQLEEALGDGQRLILRDPQDPRPLYLKDNGDGAIVISAVSGMGHDTTNRLRRFNSRAAEFRTYSGGVSRMVPLLTSLRYAFETASA